MTAAQTKKQVTTFAVKLLIFLATVAALDIVIGKMLRKNYDTIKGGENYLASQSIAKADSQVMIFGSSRAVNILNPAVLASELKASCFNAGRMGQSVFYHYAVLEAVLKRYTPAVVILSIDAADFAKGQEDYDKLSQLLPYYSEHPEIRAVAEMKGPFEKIKMLSFIYPYNSLVLPIMKAKLAPGNGNYMNNGYMPLEKKVQGPRLKVDYAKTALLDSNKVNAYRKFIDACKERNVQLFIVCPPYRIDASGTDKTIETAGAIAKEQGIDFFNYARDTFYTANDGYFADFRHLNKTGADIFSLEVAKKIKAGLDEKM